MQRLLDMARQIAPTDCSVLITGESGTGKELFAKYLHRHSSRAEGPYVAINCGAFSEQLLANELFGHEKGAFTGATALKKGLIEASAGGTLFLDEVTEMAPSMQVKLLRVLQEKEVLRLGGTRPVKCDVRVLAATNRDVSEAVKNGSFREDLYFRLNVVNLHIPPLSGRKGDIPLLAHHFLLKYASRMKKPVTRISGEVLRSLMGYSFPGNVRELENLIERGTAIAQGEVIELEHLPDNVRKSEARADCPHSRNSNSATSAAFWTRSTATRRRRRRYSASTVPPCGGNSRRGATKSRGNDAWPVNRSMSATPRMHKGHEGSRQDRRHALRNPARTSGDQGRT